MQILRRRPGRAGAVLAEELLALVTSRERAGAIAGDLTEEAACRGYCWFCRALAGCAAALFAHAFGAGRVRVLLVLCCGFAAWLIAYVGVRVAGAALGLQPLVLPVAPALERPWPVLVYLGATLVLSGVVAGVVLGSRRPAHGLNPCAPLAMFWGLAAVAAPVLDLVAGTWTWHCTLLYVVGLPLLYMLPLMVGGALGARRRHAGAG